MRKTSTALVPACLLAFSMAGCGEQTKEQQYGEKLENLTEQVNAIQYDRPGSEGNARAYSGGTTVQITTGQGADQQTVDIDVEGATYRDAVYVDQALSLIPLAEDIAANGNPTQQGAANYLIATIYADEASHLIRISGMHFQNSMLEVVSLRDRLDLIKQIDTLSNNLSGNREQIMAAVRSGEIDIDGDSLRFLSDYPDARILRTRLERLSSFEGLENLRARLRETQDKADQARQELDELRNRITEQEQLATRSARAANQLETDAANAQGEARYDKLDQMHAANRIAQTARVTAELLQTDVQAQESAIEVYEAELARLQGEHGGRPVMPYINELFPEAAARANVRPTTTRGIPLEDRDETPTPYEDVEAMLQRANAFNGTDAQRVAMFCAQLEAYGNNLSGGGNFGSQGSQSPAARISETMLSDIYAHLGLIATVELRVNQLQLELDQVAGTLQDLEDTRAAQINEMTAEFRALDNQIQAAGFHRMALAADQLTAAQNKLLQSGISRNGGLHEMSIYTLHARALSQHLVAVITYATTLETLAAYGPGLLGQELHDHINARMAGLIGEFDREDTLEMFRTEIQRGGGDVDMAESAPPAVALILMHVRNLDRPSLSTDGSQYEQGFPVAARLMAESAALESEARDTARRVFEDADTDSPSGLIAAQSVAIYGSIMGQILDRDLGFDLDAASFEDEGPAGEVILFEGVEDGDDEDFDDVDEDAGNDPDDGGGLRPRDK